MSSESFEEGNSSLEDIELTDLSRSSADYSDSGASADFAVSSRGSIEQNETKNKVNDVAISFLDISDENRSEFNIKRAFLSSLESISPGNLTNTVKSSSDWQASVLTRKSTSPGGPSIKNVPCVDPLKETSTGRVWSSDFSTLEEPSIRRVTSLDTLKKHSSRKISSVNFSEGSLNRKVSSLDSLEIPSTGRVSSVDPLERPSDRRILSLEPLKGPMTRRVLSLDHLQGSSRRVWSLDPLGKRSSRRVRSLDPLEGPSTKTVWFSDPDEGSLPNINQRHSSEESDESINGDPPTEQSTLAWLRSLSRRFRRSKYYLLFHVALLAIPCSAGYMGSKYQTMCNGCPKLPMLVYLFGIFLMWILTIRIAVILSKRYFYPVLTGRELNAGMMGILFIFFLLLIIEIPTIILCEPEFILNPREFEKFCIKAFYNYAYYLNVTVGSVFLLLLLIHIPGCFDPAGTEADLDSSF